MFAVDDQGILLARMAISLVVTRAIRADSLHGIFSIHPHETSATSQVLLQVIAVQVLANRSVSSSRFDRESHR
jgi:hypothetical protein